MQTHTDPIRGREAPVRDPRAGVALLIVLGLLALLMITAVAFTILMRIERASASNLRHTTAARQMAKGGLAYAIAALNAEIGTSRYPAWTNRLYTPFEHDPSNPNNRRKLRIPEEIFFSVDEEKRYFNQVAEARVLTVETARYLPGALRHRAEMIRDMAGKVYDCPEWIPVTKDGAKNGDIIGRYAYVILNTSGLLDANCVHTNTTAALARWLGADPGELQLHPDVQRDVVPQDMSQPLQFALDRARDGRYETTPELAELNKGVKGPALANFDVFSYAVPDMMPVEPVPGASDDMKAAHKSLMKNLGGDYDKKIPARRIDISTEAKIKEQRNNILLAFRACGLKDDPKYFYLATAKWAYLGLLDYVDDDNEPAYVPEWGPKEVQQFARPATEAMPLFSLFGVDMIYKGTEDAPDAGPDMVRHIMEYRCSAQFDYPFQSANGAFTLDAELEFLPGPEEDKWEDLMPDKKIVLNGSVENCVPGECYFIHNDNNRFVKKSDPRNKNEGRPRLNFGVLCKATTKNTGGTMIRRTPSTDSEAPPNSTVNMDDDDFERAAEPDVGFAIWAEALDSRFNWDGITAYWRASRADGLWSPGDPAEDAPLNKLPELPVIDNRYVYQLLPNLGSMNSLTEHMLRDPVTMTEYFHIVTDEVRIGDYENKHLAPVDMQRRVHVADNPLKSVGELGYLPIGLWLTISLYDHGHAVNSTGNIHYKNNTLPAIGYHPVLDYFVIGDPDKGRRGLVNLNSRSPGVLGALFNKLPVQSEVNTDSAMTPEPRIKPSWTGSCDDALELAQWLARKGPFERLSDLGRFFKDTPRLGIASGAYTDPYPLAALSAAVGADRGVGEFEREALIRNLCNLVTLRGQTFTIILRADAFSTRFGRKDVATGSVLATAMAVAQVWRDTEPMVTESRDAAGKLVYTYNYPTFVQFFKILNE